MIVMLKRMNVVNQQIIKKTVRLGFMVNRSLTVSPKLYKLRSLISIVHTSISVLKIAIAKPNWVKARRFRNKYIQVTIRSKCGFMRVSQQ